MMNGRVSCVLMGDGSLLIQCGGALLERGHEVRAVVTAGEAVAEWARARSLPVIAPSRALAEDLSGFGFDWFFSIANLRIVPAAVWARAGQGAANFHDGPLPMHAGLNAPAWALMAGEHAYGVSWHALTDAIDEGHIYAQAFFDIAADDTAFSLNTKCFEAGISSFNELLDRIESGTLAGQPQDLGKRSYHARDDRPYAAGLLDLARPAAEIGRLARGLSFGEGYVNPLGLPKLWLGDRAWSVGNLEILDRQPDRPPGTVLAVDDGAVDIACADGIVRVGRLTDETGAAVAPAKLVRAGVVIEPAPVAIVERMEAVKTDLARHEAHFRKRLEAFHDIELNGVDAPSATPSQPVSFDISLPDGLTGDRATAGLLAALARLSGQVRFDVAYGHDALTTLSSQLPGLVARTVPLVATVDDGVTVEGFAATVASELTDLRRRGGLAADLAARLARPIVLSPTVAIVQSNTPSTAQAVANAALTFIVPDIGAALARCVYERNRLSDDESRAMRRRLEAALAAFASDAARPVTDLPLMSPGETAEMIDDRNRSQRDYDRGALTVTLIEAQVRRTPDTVALVHGGRQLTYRQLDDLANRVAQDLIARGVGPDKLVGLHLRRSCDLVVAALAIWKAGGAYVPLDPTYPADRIALMIEDSGLGVLIADPDAEPAGLPAGIHVLTVATALGARPTPQPLPERAEPHHLAYVIYTSGSTGRPKGVMVEHRNVVNFFAGMDDRIARPEDGRQPVWLAVTSLSFDISVLELFWTLANGFKVVIHSDDSRKQAAAGQGTARAARSRGMDFGLFYWGDDDAEGADKYRLLIEGARFADARGFKAVWTPERHFSAFGGPYPNPAVTGAAVAAITKNVSVRAGSCVLPLHHPARVAEDWAIIDNLSNGRVAIAMASGWMPEDFLLRPENAPPANKAAMMRDIDVVRRLWRGEKVAFPAPGGKVVDITTLPRPVQRELPVWLTTAGNPETFREAARLGVNVLTHLLGQSIDEVADKVRIYREELVKVGRDPAAHTVTLMLHTLVGRDREVVREQARGPMKHYLRSAAMLIKEYAWAFPAFKKPKGVARPMDLDLRTLTDDELEAILEFAFLRYFDDSGLFGTVEEAKLRVEQLAAIGIDEIACLIDFGVPADAVLSGLEPLAEVVGAFPQTQGSKPAAGIAPAPPAAVDSAAEEGIGALIRRHGVTHLQCTPAMATMLLSADDDRGALHLVRHMFLGGEALQGALLKDLGQVTGATIENMYGPTETTIWSSTTPALPTDGNVPLGTPIANTQLYVLDNKLRPQPVGLAGELFIGGDGVTRGYYNRPDLTAERFLPNPFVAGGRMYRTGDLVRIGGDGALHFLGRADFQVKVRGYRIELGEIENCLGLHPAVGQAVVVAREDVRGDVRIVAYIRFKAAKVSDDTLRAHLRQTLPEFMVPAHFVAMEQFPLTPNAKVDRKALPRPDAVASAAPAEEYVAPSSDVERQIADVFKRILGLDRVGLNDNFFGLGGHSLLAVQAHRAIKSEVTQELKITDIYRFPTVAGLAGHLRGGQQADKSLDKVAARAAQRRNAMAGRRAGLSRPEG